MCDAVDESKIPAISRMVSLKMCLARSLLATNMDILIVTPFFAPQTGGVATYMENLRRSLSSRGHQVIVLLPGDSQSISPRAGRSASRN
jgi:hypothetical protein